MALNKELNEYLITNKNDRTFKLSMPSISIPKPPLGKWLGRNTEPEATQEAGWFQTAQKDYCPSMTRMQRLTAFAMCLCAGLLCFILSGIYIPVLLLKARKFALLYTLGSIFFLMSFCFLWGPVSYAKSLFTSDRKYFTITYFLSLAGTLYFALGLKSTPLTALCAVIQIIAMVSFLISHIPGGSTGMLYLTRMFRSSASSTLPI